MTPSRNLLFILLCSTTSCITQAWVSPPKASSTTTRSTNGRSSSTALADVENDFGYSDNSPWALSANDLQRISLMRDRQRTLPLLLVQESLLPGQTMELGSVDRKFLQLVESLSIHDELGLVGMHPLDKRQPLNVGCTVRVKEIQHALGTTVLTVEATERVDVQGQPWFDDKQSCFVAELEVAKDDSKLEGDKLEQASEWFHNLVPLMEEWADLMVDAGHEAEVSRRDIDAIENGKASYTKRAFDVAALLNPSPAYSGKVCLEIRPALLACRNDLDRLYLVHTALVASIQHLQGHDVF